MKEHWDHVYQTKEENELSWFQPWPATSIAIVDSLHLSPGAYIIDVGGGDSHFVDALLEKGYQNIWVLDISLVAIERAKKRLGEKAGLVNWVVADITAFSPPVQFDYWHDRATFHFLTTGEMISRYMTIAEKAIKQNGYMTLATFSDQGPKKCSGLGVRQYSANLLVETFKQGFEKLNCSTEDHITPFGTRQQFQFCSFKRK